MDLILLLLPPTWDVQLLRVNGTLHHAFHKWAPSLLLMCPLTRSMLAVILCLAWLSAAAAERGITAPGPEEALPGTAAVLPGTSKVPVEGASPAAGRRIPINALQRCSCAQLGCWEQAAGLPAQDLCTRVQSRLPLCAAGWAALGDISATAASACAAFAWDSGSACCWGRQLGAGAGGGAPALVNLSAPTPLAAASAPSWRQLSTGSYFNATTGAVDAFTCGIQADGSAACFGSDTSGMGLLGAGAPGSSLQPRPLAATGPWSAISAGAGFSCALHAVGGAAWCFGEQPAFLTPQRRGMLCQAVAASPVPRLSGCSTRCPARRAPPTQHAAPHAGSNEHAALGCGQLPDVLPATATPCRVEAGQPWQQVVAGQRTACAVNNTGGLFCCELGGRAHRGWCSLAHGWCTQHPREGPCLSSRASPARRLCGSPICLRQLSSPCQLTGPFHPQGARWRAPAAACLRRRRRRRARLTCSGWPSACNGRAFSAGTTRVGCWGGSGGGIRLTQGLAVACAVVRGQCRCYTVGRHVLRCLPYRICGPSPLLPPQLRASVLTGGPLNSEGCLGTCPGQT